jgi:hypothetical protein
LESFSSTERFAQVVLADVLEHMVDPWQALRRVVDDLMERDGTRDRVASQCSELAGAR